MKTFDAMLSAYEGFCNLRQVLLLSSYVYISILLLFLVVLTLDVHKFLVTVNFCSFVYNFAISLNVHLLPLNPFCARAFHYVDLISLLLLFKMKTQVNWISTGFSLVLLCLYLLNYFSGGWGLKAQVGALESRYFCHSCRICGLRTSYKFT